MNFKSLTLLLILLAVCCIASFGQTPSGTRAFSSLDGGYIVEVSKTATQSTTGPLKMPDAGLDEGYFRRWKDDGVFFQAAYIAPTVKKSATRTEAEKEAMLEQVVRLMAEPGRVDGYKVVSEKVLQPTGRGWDKGREILYDSGSRILIVHYFASEHNVVVAMADTTLEPVKLRAAHKFLNSMRLATREEIIAQKLANATPGDLPQTKPASYFQPELADMAKGRVKEISEEIEDFGDDKRSKGKNKKIDHYFDAQGYLNRSVTYDYQGHPQQSIAYGFLDGARVSKNAQIDNERVMFGVTAQRPGAPVKKRDVRFSTSVAEKYDSKKRVTERIFYDNAGELFLRAVYSYRAGAEDIYEYKKNGALQNKITRTLDAKGNLVGKFHQELGTQPRELTYTYKYETFDSSGNWTKRSVTMEVKRDGKIAYSTTYNEYRTIAYHR